MIVPLAAVALATAPLAEAPRNPERRPVVVQVEVDRPLRARLRIARDGRAVAFTPLEELRPGTRRIVWRGGRGPSADGEVVPDGGYTLQAVTAAGRGLPTTPAAVRVDTTPPRVGIVVPEPTVPLSGAGLGLVVRDRDPEGLQARAVVRDMRDRPLAAGGWAAAGDTLTLPPALARRRVVGPVRVLAEARDRAGNVATGGPDAWAVQPPAGPARIVRRVRTGKPYVSLTFDDGYDAGAAASILSTARSAGVTVTFCFNGVNAGVWSASLRAAMRRAAADGTLENCSHGYGHRTGTGTSFAQGRADLVANAGVDRIMAATSVPFYRPPYGAYGPGLMAAAGDLGYRYVLLWSIDTNDWRGRSSAQITAQVVGQARPGSIVLMHAKGNSAAALPGILAGLRARGLRPVGVGELISSGTPTAG